MLCTLAPATFCVATTMSPAAFSTWYCAATIGEPLSPTLRQRRSNPSSALLSPVQ